MPAWLPVAVDVGVVVLIVLVAVPLCLRARRRRRAQTALGTLGLDAATEAALTPLLLAETPELSAEGLGAGGFGRVVRGQWRGAPVAVKLLHAAIAEDAAALDAVAQEAALQASLRHPHIVQLFGVTVVKGTLALVMELCDSSL